MLTASYELIFSQYIQCILSISTEKINLLMRSIILLFINGELIIVQKRL